MPFPDSPRVIYHKNPLAEVICQLRFPPVLRIVTELPAKFQDSIRHEYPLYEAKTDEIQPLPPEVLDSIPQNLLQMLPNVTGLDSKRYNFRSLDGRWVITLAKDFLALTTDRYSKWETFEGHISQPVRALHMEYSPLVFTRIGLRYRNIIRRSALGVSDVPWSHLLQPYIAGLLASDSLKETHVSTSFQVAELDLTTDLGKVTLRHGLVVEESTEEVCYLIDSDFYTTEQKGNDDVFALLQEYNLRARRLFRWCIKDRLHDAMEPEPL